MSIRLLEKIDDNSVNKYHMNRKILLGKIKTLEKINKKLETDFITHEINNNNNNNNNANELIICVDKFKVENNWLKKELYNLEEELGMHLK